MNNKIRSFLRLRKQSDTVKIICLFVLAATAFFVSVIYHAWDIYRFVNTPAEYGRGRGRFPRNGWMS